MNKLYEIGDTIIFHSLEINVNMTYCYCEGPLKDDTSQRFISSQKIVKPHGMVISAGIDDEGVEVYVIGLFSNDHSIYVVKFSRHFLEENTSKVRSNENSIFRRLWGIKI